MDARRLKKVECERNIWQVELVCLLTMPQASFIFEDTSMHTSLTLSVFQKSQILLQVTPRHLYLWEILLRHLYPSEPLLLHLNPTVSRSPSSLIMDILRHLETNSAMHPYRLVLSSPSLNPPIARSTLTSSLVTSWAWARSRLISFNNSFLLSKKNIIVPRYLSKLNRSMSLSLLKCLCSRSARNQAKNPKKKTTTTNPQVSLVLYFSSLCVTSCLSITS